jgi:hypothetical protein
MQRRVRLNLLLLAAVVVAGWLVWRDVNTPPPTVPVERLTGLDPRAVSRLEIIREADGRTTGFLREAGRWWLRREPRLPADELRVGEVLRLVDAASEASYDLAAVDAQELGLEPPRARVRVDDVELVIGAQEPLRYRRYVASGGRVHLVADTAYVHLGADWTAFVDPAPLADLEEVRSASKLSANSDEPVSEEQLAAWRDLVADEVRGVVAPDANSVVLTFHAVDGGSRQMIAWRRGEAWWLAWRDGVVSYAIPAVRGPELGLE